MYPPRTNCENISEMFNGRPDPVGDFKNAAEFDKYWARKRLGNGQYMCYCKEQKMADVLLKGDTDICFQYYYD